MYMFVHNFVKLKKRFMSHRVQKRTNLATMLKTILPSLPRTVKILKVRSELTTNCAGLLNVREQLCSSDPSLQSWVSSQTRLFGMHSPLSH